VVHVRPTIFLEHPFFKIWASEGIQKNGEIRLPLGSGRTNPIATLDVARVIVEILCAPNPKQHSGKIYELTGPKSQDLHGIVNEYAQALHRPVKYVDVAPEQWAKQIRESSTFSGHVIDHIVTMAELHRQNRYDRVRPTVNQITGVPPMSVKQWVQQNLSFFENPIQE